jgi:hypothetical protein
MAQYAFTFTSGDTVTPTKLNNARTVSEIVDADISATAAIAGSKLADGAITDAKVDASAAIAGTKIAPDFGSQNVVTSGGISVVSDSTVILSTNRASSDVNPPELRFLKSRGTQSARSVVQNGDVSGRLRFFCFDGTSDAECARIFAAVDGTVGASDMPARLVFATTADGNSTPTERMRIDSSGNVGIGTTPGSHRLDISGSANVSSQYRVGGLKVLESRKTGWGSPTGTATRGAFDTASVTLEQLARRVKALVDDLRGHGLIGS